MWDSPLKPSEPGLFFEDRFLTTNSVSLLVIGIFGSSISSRVSFVSLSVLLELSYWCTTYTHFIKICFYERGRDEGREGEKH